MGEIFTHIIDMPSGIWGHVNENPDGSYTIFINARLSTNMQQDVYFHELRHIAKNDFIKYNVDNIENAIHKEGYI